MSIDICSKCDRHVDTDYTELYREELDYKAICDSCVENIPVATTELSPGDECFCPVCDALGVYVRYDKGDDPSKCNPITFCTETNVEGWQCSKCCTPI